ncbi:glycosyltransferase family 4 protein [Haloimpatiens sp. FM7315]|uniref:glycosyltransferase family 4 protein n=1 Tax=Haloimpatiens sp. FM7315 TaxID=3298609 RepID=UPI0035A3AF87
MDKLILFVASAVISFSMTPLVKRLAIKNGAMDIPKGERKIHKKPMPLLGGLSIYIAFSLVLILKKGNVNFEEIGILLGSTIIVIGGYIDDIRDLRPRYKILFQVSAAIFLIIFGVSINVITNPFSSSSQYLDIHLIGVPLTILWVVGITNAFNLIDGLDGLSSGLAFIASMTIFIIAILNGRQEASTLTIILSGAILGFLPYNFNPATIFLGDTGSQLLGFLLAAISIKGAIKSAAAFTIAVPIITLGLPIYDTLFAMIRRKINGKPIMKADKGHLHHRLLAMGLSQRKAVLIMYIISVILGGISIIAMQISNQKAYFLMAVVIIIIVLLGWKAGFFKHKE